MGEILSVYVDDVTFRRLQAAQSDNGMTPEQMAEAAVENTMCDYFRHRSDDPATQKDKMT